MILTKTKRGIAALADADIQKLVLRQRLLWYKEAGKNTKFVIKFISAFIREIDLKKLKAWSVIVSH